MHELMKQIQPLSTHEKLQLAEDLWDDIAATKSPLPLSAETRLELDRRIAAHRANPVEGVTLDEIVRGLGVRL